MPLKNVHSIYIGGALLGLVILGTVLFVIFCTAPSNFPQNITITIESGQSVTSIARELKEKNLVRSSLVLRSAIILMGGERKGSAGLYVFTSSQNVFTIAKRIVESEFGYVPVKITIPEGSNVFKIAEYVKAKFPEIDQNEFLNEIKSKEGYLFPNTYFFPPQATSEIIVSLMSEQFEREIKNLEITIAASGHSLKEIITMASILEGEVQTTTDRKMVADLLWRRISIGMPLQVDTTFAYVNGKTSAELTLKDLKIDSRYNTYVYKGLPPTPISNPGLETIRAALDPTPNDYLFFLSDKNGITHFARTHDEHVKLKQQYLR